MNFKNIMVSSVTAFAVAAVSFGAYASEDCCLYLNNSKIDGAQIISDGGDTMLPVRNLCEALGMKVEWIGDTNTVKIEKGNKQISFNPSKDGYYVGDAGFVELRKAPKVLDCVTYVPILFVENLLGGEAVEKDGSVYVESGAPETAVRDVLCTDVSEKSVTVYDIVLSDVVLNISDGVKITDKDGTALALEDITKGSILTVEYSAAMTLSLPPINTPVSIAVHSDKAASLAEGTVCEVSDKSVTIGSKDDIYSQTVLNIADGAVILSAEGKEIDISDIKEGDKIKAVASLAETRSIPPQRAAYALRIQ